MNRIAIFVLVLAFTLTSVALAADQAASKPAKANQAPATPKMMDEGQSMGPRGAMKSNFNMMMGTVSKIDMTDPANVKLEVKNERDNLVHTVEVTPATNVTKATEISEIKVGDTVRVMARKVDDKEVAMGVMFGKFKRLPPYKSAPIAGKPGAEKPPSPAKEATKK